MENITSDDEDVPDYSNWKKPDTKFVQVPATTETLIEEEYNLPDYEKWAHTKKSDKLKKDIPILEQLDLPKEKIEIFREILNETPKDVKFEKRETFSFLAQDLEDDDPDEGLSYEEWKKKKFSSDKKDSKKPVDFLKMIQELEQKQETLKPQMNKEEHQKFVFPLYSSPSSWNGCFL